MLAILVKRQRVIIPLSIAAFVIVFGINSRIAWRGCEELREKYRVESLETRLPERSSAIAGQTPKPSESFGSLEAEVDGQIAESSVRPLALKELHDRAVFVFINQPNFGVFRGMSVAKWRLELGTRQELPIPQPGSRSASTETTEIVGKFAIADGDLTAMHGDGTLDFVHPRGFGYFKDRRHVAGFQSHQFGQVPDAGKKWKLQALDLMGLVVHEKPVVYLSENLPRMDELRKAPMRELNAFELAGLKALRDGDEIFVREMPDHSVRMLGSLRAMKQCIDCHGGARGDLLGAFSYELRTDG